MPALLYDETNQAWKDADCVLPPNGGGGSTTSINGKVYVNGEWVDVWDIRPIYLLENGDWYNTLSTWSGNGCYKSGNLFYCPCLSSTNAITGFYASDTPIDLTPYSAIVASIARCDSSATPRMTLSTTHNNRSNYTHIASWVYGETGIKSIDLTNINTSYYVGIYSPGTGGGGAFFEYIYLVKK